MTPLQAAFTLRSGSLRSGSTHPYVRIALDFRSQSAPSGRRQSLLLPCLPLQPVCRSEPVRGISPAHRNAKDHAVDRLLIHRPRYGPSRLTRNTAARAPNSDSVMDVEVHKIPGDREPDQAQAGKRQCRIVQLGPDPTVGRAPASKCVHAGQDGATGAQQTEDAKTDDPGSKGINRAGIRHGLCQNRQPPSEETDEEDADEPHTKPQLALQRT